MSTYTIKPLEWKPDRMFADGRVAAVPWGSMSIFSLRNQPYWHLHCGDGNTPLICTSMEEAKQKADAVYRERMLTGLIEAKEQPLRE